FLKIKIDKNIGDLRCHKRIISHVASVILKKLYNISFSNADSPEHLSDFLKVL
ncbi:hypothetical protein ACJX0J_028843, partial [Zea mays]